MKELKIFKELFPKVISNLIISYLPTIMEENIDAWLKTLNEWKKTFKYTYDWGYDGFSDPSVFTLGVTFKKGEINKIEKYMSVQDWVRAFRDFCNAGHGTGFRAPNFRYYNVMADKMTFRENEILCLFYTKPMEKTFSLICPVTSMRLDISFLCDQQFFNVLNTYKLISFCIS